ncbi:MAG: transporter substrate-binding domain-containing protein [Gammaproteobacteria bacterium]
MLKCSKFIKSMKSLALIGACFLSNFSGAENQIHDVPKVIHFATEATYPPFEYVEVSGKMTGFDIELAQALCAELKAECKFSNLPWDSLIPSLQVGKIDAIIGGIAITETRKQQVHFTEPYYLNTLSFASKDRGLNLSKEGLKGKIIGLQGGTTFDQYLQKNYGSEIKIRRYPSQQSAFLDLTAGRVNAVFGDTAIVKDWVKRNGKGKYFVVGDPIKDESLFNLECAIAVSKQNQPLVDALNRALKNIKSNGTHQKLETKYFGDA